MGEDFKDIKLSEFLRDEFQNREIISKLHKVKDEIIKHQINEELVFKNGLRFNIFCSKFRITINNDIFIEELKQNLVIDEEKLLNEEKIIFKADYYSYLLDVRIVFVDIQNKEFSKYSIDYKIKLFSDIYFEPFKKALVLLLNSYHIYESEKFEITFI